MKISEFIRWLEKKQKELGDIYLYAEHDDGRSTWGAKVSPSIKHTIIWKGHSQPPHHYITL